MGDVPGTAAATGCILSQRWTYTHCQESANPASERPENARSFAEAKVAVPTPHIRGLWSVCEAESEELPLLRSGHRTLGLIHFELELLRDELRDALHHSLTGSLTPHGDIAIIRRYLSELEEPTK